MRRFRRMTGWLALALGVGVSLGTLAQVQAQEELSLIHAVTQARETCYATVECANLDELTALFTDTARRTEIQRNNNVVLLETAEALRDDHRRVAGGFPGRRLETLGLFSHGRNVVALQRNWDPGAAEPNPFISVFRIEEGKVAHWILIAP